MTTGSGAVQFFKDIYGYNRLLEHVLRLDPSTPKLDQHGLGAAAGKRADAAPCPLQERAATVGAAMPG